MLISQRRMYKKMQRSNLNQIFAVVRTQSIRGPSFQFLRIRRIRHLNDENVYSLEVPPFPFEAYHGRYEETYEIDRHIYTFRYYSGLPGITEYKYWFLPFRLHIDGHEIPVVDFQYKSWLPTHYSHIPIHGNTERFMDVLENVHQQRCRQIEDEEPTERHPRNINSHFFDYHFRRPMEEPDEPMFSNTAIGAGRERRSGNNRRRRNHENNNTTTTTTTSSSRTHHPILVIDSDNEEEEERQPERVIVTMRTVEVQVKTIPIPKPIALLILAEARKGDDSCPIAAQPFKECSKLSVCPCFHIFDSESIERWKNTNDSCPICRTKIDTIVSEEQETQQTQTEQTNTNI